MKKSAINIVKKLRKQGYKAFFAGGCVRDMVMNKKPEDYDITTDAKPEEVKKMFPRTVDVGKKFGVTMIPVNNKLIEVATFRTEGPYLDGRRPTEVRFTNEKEDVLRRDFTINGLLYDPLEDRILDYVNGVEDIKKKVVRSIGDPYKRFSEDKLRMIRAIRFASNLNFILENETEKAINMMAHKIHQISSERIRDELTKMLTRNNPQIGIKKLHKTGLLKEILPEVDAMAGVPQPEKFHPEGDVFTHTLKMLEMMKNPTVTLAYGVLLHDVGKPPTIEFKDRIRFNEHDRVGASISENICSRLKFSNAEKKQITALVKNHQKFMYVKRMKESTLKRFISMENFEEYLELHRLDCLASHKKLGNYQLIKEKLETLTEEDIKPEALITGHDLIELGLKPGPQFSQILDYIKEEQLEENIKTKQEAINLVKKKFL